jgi:phosphatidylglycerophosphatase A
LTGTGPGEPSPPAKPGRSSLRALLARFRGTLPWTPEPPLVGAKAMAVKVLGSFFGAGYLPLAPGTWGSLAALVIWLWLRGAVLGAGLRAGLADNLCFLLCAGFAMAALALGRSAERVAQAADPRWFVLDELAGAFLALYGLAGYNGWLWLAAGSFLLFRLLDATKLGLIGWTERRLRGGMGILMDDLFAGAAANLAVRGAAWALGATLAVGA